MSSKSVRTAAVAGVLAVSAIAGYWYWSPHLAIRNMQAAAQAKDADAFNDYVDYPKLRESFKGQFSALMVDRLGESKAAENPFAALGTMMAMAMVGNLVDAMVRPEAVMHIMQDGKLAQPGKPSSDAPPGPSGTAPQTGTASDGGDKPKWDYERKGANKLIAYAVDPNKPDAAAPDRFGVVFQRSGFADWKLTEVRMPAMNK
jgi:hypothetical protein